MTESIGMSVGHHLRLSACSGGKIHQEYVVIGIYILRAPELRHGFPFPVKIVEALRDLRSDAYQTFYRRALRHCLKNMSGNLTLTCADNRLDICAVVTVDYILAGKHVRGRDCHSANLAEGHHCKPELIAALQHYHNHISLPDPERLEVGCRTVRKCLDILE